MGLRKQKSLLDQATDKFDEYVDVVKPQLETALASAKDKAGPAIADAKTKAGPVLADARAKAAPVIADARAKAGPAIASGAAIAAEKVAAGAAIAAEKAADAAEAAADMVAEVAEPPKKKGGKLKKFALLGGLVAGLAFVASKLRGSKEADNWQSSYSPTPAPTPAPAPPSPPVTPAAPTSGANDDGAGASPDEALADQVEAPHPVTTPDEPAEVVELHGNDEDDK